MANRTVTVEPDDGIRQHYSPQIVLLVQLPVANITQHRATGVFAHEALNELSTARSIDISSYNDETVKNSGCGRKRPWPTLRYYSTCWNA
jgi:hypothetical protein